MKPLKARGLADMLGLSVDSIQLRAAAGGIPGAFRTQGDRGHWRISPEDAEAYVTAIKTGTPVIVPRKKKQHVRMPTADVVTAARARARQAMKEARGCHPS